MDWVESTGSTNVDIRAQIAANPSTPRVLLTDEQTEGKGRRDRSWKMIPAGGVLMSIYVPWSDAETAHVANTALGVAVVDAVDALAPAVVPRLKWPNDLLAGNKTHRGRKLAGMLSEAVMNNGQILGVICGMGLNVSWPTATDTTNAADAEILARAACLQDAAGHEIDRHELARSILGGFDTELDRFSQLGIRTIHDRYRDRCSTIGTEVRVERPDGALVGKAIDLDVSGALLVEADGRLHQVEVGDVVHLRSNG